MENKAKENTTKQKTSKYKGVKKQKNRWIAYWKGKYLGSFLTEDEAYEKVCNYIKENKL